MDARHINKGNTGMVLVLSPRIYIYDWNTYISHSCGFDETERKRGNGMARRYRNSFRYCTTCCHLLRYRSRRAFVCRCCYSTTTTQTTTTATETVPVILIVVRI